MAKDISRRRLFAIGAGATGAAAATSLLPPSLQAALAAQPTPPEGGLDAIEHVVLLMQENRSFDHYFGMLRGVRGFADPGAVRLPGGGTVFQQPKPGGGTVLPFAARDAAEAQKKDLQYVGQLDHSWSGGARAWNNGWMDNWIAAKSSATMVHFQREDIPFHYELADTFTICDAYHSAIHSSTSPNRNFWVSGTTGYEADGKRAVGNDAYAEDTHPGYSWTSTPEILQRTGVSWKVYQEWDNFQDNNVEFYKPFKDVARKALADLGFKSTNTFYTEVLKASGAKRQQLLDGLEAGLKKLTDAERQLFERGLRRVEEGGFEAAFRADVEAGKLPKVSYLVPSALDSEHPGPSTPAHSATVTYKILDALASRPEVWRKTAVFITYDENDGFFDHVVPPAPPTGTADEWWEGKPVGLGIRVPMLIVSPWTVGGYVSSEIFDHTSINRFMERWLGIEVPNISAWRRTVCGDLTGAFDFSGTAAPQPLRRPGPIPPDKGHWTPLPPADQRMPRQESGSRPARPLPYQPEVSGAYEPAEGLVRLALANSGSRSAHAILFPYAGEYVTPQHRDIAAGKISTWDVPVKDGRYDFTVTGPNGFRREFKGTAEGAAAGVRVRGSIDARRLLLTLTVTNKGKKTLRLTLRPQDYVADAAARSRTVSVRGGSTRAVEFSAREGRGWYDLVLTAEGDPGFHRRLAGHIECGNPSVSG
ncbi:phosphocholine-specific phospholipase C [Streptomyces sp. P1-3]|uniref:phosphocholine-specific phospholipase C n=1 Tax=Streptomyces sp. P1-3 TaxID=3421658 RepID=UPI003D3685D5